MRAKRRTSARVAVIAIAFSLLAGSAAIADPVGDMQEPADTVEELLTEPDGDVESVEIADNPDPTSPFARMSRALIRIEYLSSDPTRGPIDGLDRLADHARAARGAYANRGDLAATFGSIVDALVDAESVVTPDRGTAGTLAEIAAELAGASEAIASAQLSVGKSAQVDAQILEQAEKKIVEGVEEVSAGQTSSGARKFKDAFGLVNPELQFDLPRFMAGIKAAFSGTTVGYQVAFRKDGVPRGGWAEGHRRQGKKDGWEDMSHTSREIIASVSKTVTAIGVVKLLKSRKLPLNASIWEWLPPTWKKHGSLGSLTFEQLLRHRVRWVADEGKNPLAHYGTVKAWLQQGIELPASKQTWRYRNVNYTVLAIAMARLWKTGEAALKKIPKKKIPIQEPELLASLYERYINEKVFASSHIESSTCATAKKPSVLYYKFKAESKQKGGKWELIYGPCAHGGWHLSAWDLMNLTSGQDHAISLGAAERDLMDDRYLGWWNEDSATSQGKFGIYRHHPGDLRNGSGQGMGSCIMKFPVEDVQVGLLTNSIGGAYGQPGTHQCTALRDAFDSAWVAKPPKA